MPSIFVYGQLREVEGIYSIEQKYMYSLSSWPSSAEIEVTVEQYECTFAGTSVISRIEPVQNLRFIGINLFIIIRL